jgi:hypothetical protein
MSRMLTTMTIAGTVLGLGSVAMGQSSLDLERAYAAELSADAESRTSLLQAGSADPSSLTITSADGASSLSIGALVQFRYVANFRDDSQPVGSNDDFTHGYELTRTRLDFTGTALSPQISYRVSVEAGDHIDGGAGAGDLNATWVYGQYDFEGAWDGAFVRFGTFKLPLFASELVDPEYSQSVERTQTNEFFNQGYSTGFLFGYEEEAWAAYGAVSDGVRTAGTSFNGPEADVALTGRFEYKIQGDWAQFQDLSSFRGSEDGMKVGAAIHYQRFGDTGGALGPSPLAGASGNLINYTADFQWEGNGWNLFAAFYGQYTDETLVAGAGGNGDEDASDFGFAVQGGYFFTEQWEGFAGYDVIILDDTTSRNFGTAAGQSGSSEDTFHFLTFGANYYFVPESHAAKASVDVVFSLSETGNLTGISTVAGNANSVTGLLGQNEDFEAVLRGQIQILF